MDVTGLHSVYPVLNRYTKIRQNEDGYYLSSLLHRRKVQLGNTQAHLLSIFDGRRSLGEILDEFGEENRAPLVDYIFKLNELIYLDCYTQMVQPPHGKVHVLPNIPAPHLQEVHLDITSECNLRCRHCYQLGYLKENLHGHEFDTDEWMGVLDQLSALNVDRVSISGGEPFMFNGLITLIQGIYERGIKLSSIFTNGVLPLDEFFCFIEDLPYPVDFSVSLDGPDSDTHERIRGPGTFASTMRNIDLLVDKTKTDRLSRYSFDVNTCVFATNVNRLEDMFTLIREKEVPRWRISLPRDEGAFLHNRHLEVDRQKAFAAYKRLLECYLAEYDESFSKRLPYLQIESIFRTTMLTRKKVAIFSQNSSCCEYKRYGIAIKPNGDVLSCTSFHSKVMGNLRERSLYDIWYDPSSQYLKRIPTYDVTACRDCRLLKFCGAGCRSNVMDRTGLLTEKDELACQIYEFFDSQIRPMLEPYGVEYVI